IVMGTIAYQWIRTYVPSEGLACPEDVSVFIKEYACGGGEFNITLKNNGKFSIAGYFIHVTNESEQEIATTDISQNITLGGVSAGGAVIFVSASTNSMKPNEEKKSVFDLTGADITNKIELVQITPVRYHTVDNKLRFVSCGGAKIKEELTCDLT
ncbi:unnamed protein product, partial [marine sediment metagenome]